MDTVGRNCTVFLVCAFAASPIHVPEISDFPTGFFGRDAIPQNDQTLLDPTITDHHASLCDMARSGRPDAILILRLALLHYTSRMFLRHDMGATGVRDINYILRVARDAYIPLYNALYGEHAHLSHTSLMDQIYINHLQPEVKLEDGYVICEETLQALSPRELLEVWDRGPNASFYHMHKFKRQSHNYDSTYFTFVQIAQHCMTGLSPSTLTMSGLVRRLRLCGTGKTEQRLLAIIKCALLGNYRHANVMEMSMERRLYYYSLSMDEALGIITWARTPAFFEQMVREYMLLQHRIHPHISAIVTRESDWMEFERRVCRAGDTVVRTNVMMDIQPSDNSLALVDVRNLLASELVSVNTSPCRLFFIHFYMLLEDDLCRFHMWAKNSEYYTTLRDAGAPTVTERERPSLYPRFLSLIHI